MTTRRRSLLALGALVLAAALATAGWRSVGASRQAARLAALAQPGDIRMLSSETCVYCAAARHWLTAHGVRFEECFIERDAHCRALYDATAARGTPTLLVRGRVQLGFDPERVLAVLDSSRG